MEKSRLIAAAISLVLAVPSLAGVKVGDIAPPVTAGSWYNMPKGVKSLTPNHLKGQIVMVEFWATW